MQTGASSRDRERSSHNNRDAGDAVDANEKGGPRTAGDAGEAACTAGTAAKGPPQHPWHA